MFRNMDRQKLAIKSKAAHFGCISLSQPHSWVKAVLDVLYIVPPMVSPSKVPVESPIRYFTNSPNDNIIGTF